MRPQPDFVDAPGWTGQLRLAYSNEGGRTQLSERAHSGPLLVQKSLYPEGPGVCHSILVHPPGGLAEGDCLIVEVDVAQAAHALLTTPGATKWYKAALQPAVQQVSLNVADEGALEWLPQENIFFNEAQIRSSTRIELCQRAAYIGWEVSCLGRGAIDGVFSKGRAQHSLEVWRDGRLVFIDRGGVDAGTRGMVTPVVLAGFTVFGTLVAVSSHIDAPLLRACQRLGAGQGACAGVTQMGEVLCARYLGNHTERAKGYFERLRRLLRPRICERPAIAPRIWST